jgi:PAS domain S-box-containing protein
MTTARILIVEDESIVALDIKSRLLSLGYDVLGIAPSGEQAVQKAAATCPDLVLMDIKLKGEMDGIEAAEQIHARFNIPVVYLTAFADDATLQRAKVAEPFGYIIKPFEERELHTTIEMALYKSRMERKLRESERWLAATLASIGDAVIATDAHGRIQFMNPVAEALTGWKQEEAVGMDVTQVRHVVGENPDTLDEHPVLQVLRTGASVEMPEGTKLVARDGKQIPIDDSVAPIRNGGESVTGTVMVFRDVTERLRAAEVLRRYAFELEERNGELDAFAHTVAHDIKSLLNLMINYSNILTDDRIPVSEQEEKKFLQIIARSGKKMSNIINELYLLSTARRDEVETGPLDMASIVASAQERLSHVIEEHNAEISLPPEWPVASGYGPWVEEVWVNYLSNGIKYGGRPPRLSLGATKEPDGQVRFWIRDNGPGITPADQERLFVPFTQLSQVRANGHGLGLSIVRRIVERLNGEVRVASRIGEGSVFAFTLPANGHRTNRPATYGGQAA